VEFLLGRKSRFSYCWDLVGSTRFSYCLESGSHCWELSGGKSIFPQYSPQYNQVFLILFDRILLGAGGKDTFSYCWEPVGRTLSQTVGSRWECLVFLLLGAGGEVYFLILLGVVGRQTHPHIVGGRGGRKSLSHIVGNRSKVALLVLLEVESGSGKSLFACWELVESRFSHIVGDRVEFLLGGKSRFLYCWESVGSTRISYCWELVGICFPHCWELVQSRISRVGIGGHSFFSLGVGREFLPSVVALNKKTPPDSKIMRK